MTLLSRLSDFSVKRVTAAVARRVTDLPDRLWWQFGASAQRNKAALRQLKDKHKGETCVIICNGPSLNQTDMGSIKHLPTICMNRSYLMFDTWGFVPTYFAATAQHVIEQFVGDISKLPMPKFINATYRHLLDGQDNCYFLRIPPRLVQAFGPDLTGPISSGGTVTYASLQVAYYMGFSKVIIIGMDHRFSAKGTPNETEVRKAEVDKDHVHPDYFPKGTKWELPDLYRSELAYAFARQAYEADGRTIIDATVDGACTIFPKMPLAEALAH